MLFSFIAFMYGFSIAWSVRRRVVHEVSRCNPQLSLESCGGCTMARQASVDAFSRNINRGHSETRWYTVDDEIFWYMFWFHVSSQLQVWASPSKSIEFPVDNQKPIRLSKMPKNRNPSGISTPILSVKYKLSYLKPAVFYSKFPEWSEDFDHLG